MRALVATPWDDFPYTKSNANTFVRARAYRVFLTSCVGINLGDIPSVDPFTLGRKTLYKLAFLKYCYNISASHSRNLAGMFSYNSVCACSLCTCCALKCHPSVVACLLRALLPRMRNHMCNHKQAGHKHAD